MLLRSIPLTAKLRRPDGSLVSLAMTDYQPKPSSTGTYYGTRHTDFNRLGRMLEGRTAGKIVFTL